MVVVLLHSRYHMLRLSANFVDLGRFGGPPRGHAFEISDESVEQCRKNAGTDSLTPAWSARVPAGSLIEVQFGAAEHTAASQLPTWQPRPSSFASVDFDVAARKFYITTAVEASVDEVNKWGDANVRAPAWRVVSGAAAYASLQERLNAQIDRAESTVTKRVSGAVEPIVAGAQNVLERVRGRAGALDNKKPPRI